MEHTAPPGNNFARRILTALAIVALGISFFVYLSDSSIAAHSTGALLACVASILMLIMSLTLPRSKESGRARYLGLVVTFWPLMVATGITGWYLLNLWLVGTMGAMALVLLTYQYRAKHTRPTPDDKRRTHYAIPLERESVPMDRDTAARRRCRTAGIGS